MPACLLRARASRWHRNASWMQNSGLFRSVGYPGLTLVAVVSTGPAIPVGRARPVMVAEIHGVVFTRARICSSEQRPRTRAAQLYVVVYCRIVAHPGHTLFPPLI